MTPRAPGALFMTLRDAPGQLCNGLAQGSGQGVVLRLTENIGTGRDQMRADAKRRARFRPPLEQDTSFVDPEGFLQHLQLLPNKPVERFRGVLVQVLEDDFHKQYFFFEQSRLISMI
jgi:hypothetical protein